MWIFYFKTCSKFGKLRVNFPSRNYRYKVDFINDSRYSLRPTKYTTYHVIENLLTTDGTDLCTGVLLARLPQCVSRKKEDILPSFDNCDGSFTFNHSKIKKPSIDCDNDLNSVKEVKNTSEVLTISNSQHNTKSLIECSNAKLSANINNGIAPSSVSNNVKTNDEHSSDRIALEKHLKTIRETIENFCHMKNHNDSNSNTFCMSNPFRMPYDTTYLFVKSKILFPNEWYLPTLFVTRYTNIHEAANSIITDVLKVGDDAVITSPLPSIALIETIPKNHPLYEKLKKKAHVFIYKATFHGIHDLKYDTEIIQDVQWLTVSEAKSVLKPSLYKKLETII